VPVVASNSSSLPEVVGDAGLLADPGDPGSLAVKIQAILGNPGRESELRARALAQAGRFRWERTAEQMEEVFREALG
jgi:alpha-1,3-rhamnosyl/mannosyltransferase